MLVNFLSSKLSLSFERNNHNDLYTFYFRSFNIVGKKIIKLPDDAEIDIQSSFSQLCSTISRKFNYGMQCS